MFGSHRLYFELPVYQAIASTRIHVGVKFKVKKESIKTFTANYLILLRSSNAIG